MNICLRPVIIMKSCDTADKQNADGYSERMDRIIEWVKTCDTKASIMLTLVCLMVSFVITSDFVLEGISSIFRSVADYHPDTRSLKDISISGTLCLLCLFLSLYLLLGSIYRFVMVVYSKPQESLDGVHKQSLIIILFNFVFRYRWRNLNDTSTKKDSLIHLNHIANLTYAEFKAKMTNEDYYEKEEIDDYLSQIYINAKRCKEKFEDYNSAILWMLRSVPFLILFFFLLLIFCL